MRKIFFFAALAMSASMSAQVIGWTALDYGGTTTSSGTTNIRHTLGNDSGEVFLLGQGSSVGDAPTLTMFGQAWEVCPFTPDQSKTNNNIVITKVDKDFKPLWVSVSNRGAFDDSYVGLPTSDGGLIVAVISKHIDKNQLGDNKVMQLTGSNGTSVSREEPYVEGESKKYGTIVRYSATGEPSIQAKFYPVDGSFSFCNLLSDGTYYYLLVALNPGLVIGKDTIKSDLADNEGSMAIIKLNENFEVQGYVKTGGIKVSSTTANLVYANGKLYMVTSVSAAEGKTLSMGKQSLTMVGTNSALLAVVSTDMECEKLILVEGSRENNKNSVSVNNSAVLGNNAYISGFFMGGFKTDAGILTNTGTNNAFVLKVDLTTGKCMKGEQIGSSAGIATSQKLLTRGDSLYLYYYDWGVAAGNPRINLQAYDEDLNKGAVYPLICSSQMEAAFDATIVGNALAYTFRTRSTISFAADEEQTFTASGHFTGLAAMQTLFGKPSTPTDNVETSGAINNKKTQKVIINGQLYIRRGEQWFNALGQML